MLSSLRRSFRSFLSSRRFRSFTVALLLGWVVDVVVKAVMEMPDDVADSTTKLAVISAFNKLVWLQNDLFVRWYAKSDDELAAATARTKAADASA